MLPEKEKKIRFRQQQTAHHLIFDNEGFFKAGPDGVTHYGVSRCRKGQVYLA